MQLKIKFISLLLGDKVKPPYYATEQAAGMDVSACIEDDITIHPGERAKIPCGFAIAVPQGYAGMLYARSGLASKFGIALSNAVGIIDSDYRGEVLCAITNYGDSDFTVKQGDRIAQLVIAPVQKCILCKTDELFETERGDNGFGSTGRK